jgi:nitric oxide synthase oxygenase domain/subunit
MNSLLQRTVDRLVTTRPGELRAPDEEQEAAAGRPVTGRWDWLIPPLSGATSPLWNRAYDPCEYSPNFYTQPCEMPGAAGGFECA